MSGPADIATNAASTSADTRRETFLRLIDEYGPGLQRLARAYVDEAGREDLIQEIAVAIWQALPSFRREASERTWLYRIAHNTAITAAVKLRRKSRTETPIDTTGQQHSAGGEPGDDRLIREERRELLLASVRRLSAADRQIIALHLEGLSHAEIQDVTGVSVGAIATRLSRIRDRLTSEMRRKEVGS